MDVSVIQFKLFGLVMVILRMRLHVAEFACSD